MRSGKRNKLLLVDDQRILLDVMGRQFADDPVFEVVGLAESTSAAVDVVEREHPDIVLLDIDLGGESGLDAICRLRKAHPGVRIVIVSMFTQEIYRDRAFAMGADAYVTKGTSFSSLRALLMQHDTGESSKAEQHIWRRPRGRFTARLTLSSRELQVVEALSSGQQEKEVAESLGISISSVGTYLRRALNKTGMDNRAQLFRFAAALGSETETESVR